MRLWLSTGILSDVELGFLHEPPDNVEDSLEAAVPTGLWSGVSGERRVMNEINDLTLAGIFSLLNASLLLGGFLSKVKEPDRALFWKNTYRQVKNDAIRRNDMYAGGAWLFLGTTLLIIGHVMPVSILSLWLGSTWEIIIFFVFICFVLLMVTSKKTYERSCRECKRLVIEHVQTHNVFNTIETNIEKERTLATQELDQIGEVMEILRNEGESDKKYLDRLKLHFLSGRS